MGWVYEKSVYGMHLVFHNNVDKFKRKRIFSSYCIRRNIQAKHECICKEQSSQNPIEHMSATAEDEGETMAGHGMWQISFQVN